MKKNVGKTDSLIRIFIVLVVGILILTGVITGTIAIIVGLLAVILLLTAFLGFCGIYRLLGIGTCSAKKKDK